LLDELQRGVVDRAGGQLCRDFTLGDLLNMLAELIGFEPTLARDALRLLAEQAGKRGTTELNSPDDDRSVTDREIASGKRTRQ
jgi:hypothetical protein